MWFGFYGSKPYKPIKSWISENPGWHHIMQYPDIVHDFSFLLLLCNDQDIVYIGYICTCRSTVCCMRGGLLMPYSSKPKASENIALSAKCGDITRVILGWARVSPTQMCEKWAMSVCLSVCLFTRFMVNTHLWMFLTSWQKWLKSQVSVNDSHSTSSAGKDRDHSRTCLFNHFNGCSDWQTAWQQKWWSVHAISIYLGMASV